MLSHAVKTHINFPNAAKNPISRSQLEVRKSHYIDKGSPTILTKWRALGVPTYEIAGMVTGLVINLIRNGI